MIGVVVPSWLRPERVTRHIKRALGVPFTMDIIILMCWSIWKERNPWVFNNEDPSIEKCKYTFKREFALIIHRTRKHYVSNMELWLHAIL
jgi:hypothetical protein